MKKTELKRVSYKIQEGLWHDKVFLGESIKQGSLFSYMYFIWFYCNKRLISVKIIRIWSFSGLYFPVLKTSNTDTFSRSAICEIIQIRPWNIPS